MRLTPLAKTLDADRLEYSYVTVAIYRDRRTATIELRAPGEDAPDTPETAEASLGERW